MLVGELETRMDRLRSLYDQYFMGIERLEPLVPRKDVERRMAVLRKEQIRNTGLRFKFNVIIQRFNTYQTYWLRISRQIEQGTYRRDVMRATARFGVDPTKERAPDAEPEEATRPRPQTHVLPEDNGAELESFDVDVDMDLEEEEEVENDPFRDVARPAAAAAPPRSREGFAGAVRLELDDLADPFEEHDPFPKPPAPSIAPKLRIAPRPGGPSLPPGSEPGDLHRETERRIPAASMPAPRIAVRSGTPPQPGTSAAPGALPPRPNVVIAKRASVPDEMERLPSIPSTGAGLPPPPQRQPTLTDAVPPPGVLPPTAPRIGVTTPPAMRPVGPVAPRPPGPAAPVATPSRAPAPSSPGPASSVPRVAVSPAARPAATPVANPPAAAAAPAARPPPAAAAAPAARPPPAAAAAPVAHPPPAPAVPPAARPRPPPRPRAAAMTRASATARTSKHTARRAASTTSRRTRSRPTRSPSS